MSFAAEVGNFQTVATDNIERTRRAVALKLFGAVIRDTPVLTGRLRGNWQCSLESPLTGQIPSRGGKTPRVLPSEQQAEILDVVARAKGTDKPMFLRNNLPYAARIEFDGWSSSKAPEGMMRKNVARFTRIVAEAAQEQKK